MRLKTLSFPKFVMKMFVLMILSAVFINDAAAMTHSLLYYETSSTQVPNFPQFVAVGYVNGLQLTHYDSDTRRVVPKQEWMKNITEGDPRYWDRNTQINLGNEQVYKEDTEYLRKRLNQTEGLHIHQRMFGCEWDDETNEVHGYYQEAFDGRDFIVFDLKTETFVAPRPEAVVTKLSWERIGEAARVKHYITQECVKYLKKHLRHGHSALMRKVLPEVSFLQKSPSAPVTCFASGFHPDRAMLFWTKDGEELYKGVDNWGVLPNHDGTFQRSSDLDLSSVPPEDWGRYECVFQLSGVPEDQRFRLDRSKIRTNAKDHSVAYTSVALVALGLIIVAVVVFVVVRKRRAECPPISQMDLQAQQRLNSDGRQTPSEPSAEDAEAAEELDPDGENEALNTEVAPPL